MTRMADVDAIEDGFHLSGMREQDSYVQLYPCMKNADEFYMDLNTRLERHKTAAHAKKKRKLSEYLSGFVPKIAKVMSFTVVTQFLTDHLLTVKKTGSQFIFVYFGAMTKDSTYVACWLRIQLGTDRQIIKDQKPYIFFWALHSSYTQELEGLGDSEGIDFAALEELVHYKDSINYT